MTPMLCALVPGFAKEDLPFAQLQWRDPNIRQRAKTLSMLVVKAYDLVESC